MRKDYLGGSAASERGHENGDGADENHGDGRSVEELDRSVRPGGRGTVFNQFRHVFAIGQDEYSESEHHDAHDLIKNEIRVTGQLLLCFKKMPPGLILQHPQGFTWRKFLLLCIEELYSISREE